MNERKKPYHVVLDADDVGMVITGGGREKPRGGWLARSSWVTLFPSERQARAAITRTRQFAKANAMPWLDDIRHFRIVAVTVQRANPGAPDDPRSVVSQRKPTKRELYLSKIIDELLVLMAVGPGNSLQKLDYYITNEAMRAVADTWNEVNGRNDCDHACTVSLLRELERRGLVREPTLVDAKRTP